MAMSEYGWQQYQKKLAGQTNTKASRYTNPSDIKKNGYYVKGIGYVENEPLVTTDENGQRVVQTSGLQREGLLTKDGGLSLSAGDRLAKAYDTVKGSVSGVLKKWNDSRLTPSTSDDDAALFDLYEAYKADGRYLGDYSGFRSWLNGYMAQMNGETMNVNALHNSRGVATKTSDGQLIDRSNKRGV